MWKRIATTCLLAVGAGLASLAFAGDGDQASRATHLLKVDRAWDLSEVENYPAEHGGIPDSQYKKDKSQTSYPIEFSADQQTVKIFIPLEKSAAQKTKKYVVWSGSLNADKGSVKTYDLVDGSAAGGRLIVRPKGKGYEAEFTRYGSGVWLVESERGRLVEKRWRRNRTMLYEPPCPSRRFQMAATG
jgi:hypothetical protein